MLEKSAIFARRLKKTQVLLNTQYTNVTQPPSKRYDPNNFHVGFGKRFDTQNYQAGFGKRDYQEVGNTKASAKWATVRARSLVAYVK